VAHVSGESLFAVNDAQRRDKARKGNERGLVERFGEAKALGAEVVAKGNSSSLVRRIVVPTRTITRLVQEVVGGATLADVYIPLMKLDMEGLEPASLFAMATDDLLNRTGAIVFECHKLWQQAELRTRASMSSNHSAAEPLVQTLENVVEFLASHGFVTYRIGLRYWVPLTGPYWDATYEDSADWGNCFAARAGSVEYDTQFSMLPACSRLSEG
jgi:hypothetical protein